MLVLVSLCIPHRDKKMLDSQRESQKRYAQTPKGKEALDRAARNYQAKKEIWKVYFDPEIATQLEDRNPDGLSHSALINEIVKKFLETP